LLQRSLTIGKEDFGEPSNLVIAVVCKAEEGYHIHDRLRCSAQMQELRQLHLKKAFPVEDQLDQWPLYPSRRTD